MPRPARYSPGGVVFHVLNRGVGRRNLFDTEGDFLAFERVMIEALRIRPMRVCAYCLMSNHWHFILWPQGDGDLSAFMQQLTNTHVKRWKEHRRETGYGHLYQGRYKSFPVQSDDYFYQVVRYVGGKKRRYVQLLAFLWSACGWKVDSRPRRFVVVRCRCQIVLRWVGRVVAMFALLPTRPPLAAGSPGRAVA